MGSEHTVVGQTTATKHASSIRWPIFICVLALAYFLSSSEHISRGPRGPQDAATPNRPVSSRRPFSYGAPSSPPPFYRDATLLGGGDHPGHTGAWCRMPGQWTKGPTRRRGYRLCAHHAALPLSAIALVQERVRSRMLFRFLASRPSLPPPPARFTQESSRGWGV